MTIDFCNRVLEQIKTFYFDSLYPGKVIYLKVQKYESGYAFVLSFRKTFTNGYILFRKSKYLTTKIMIDKYVLLEKAMQKHLKQEQRIRDFIFTPEPLFKYLTKGGNNAIRGKEKAVTATNRSRKEKVR